MAPCDDDFRSSAGAGPGRFLMNVKTPIEGANSLTKNALDHCIFPITHA